MGPYIAFAGLLVLIWLGIAFVKVPAARTDTVGAVKAGEVGGVLQRLVKNRHWRYGVLAQFAYVGAQVCTWTYIVIYVANVVPGGDNVLGAWFLQIGLIVYLVMRFVMTWLMGFIRPTALMAMMAGLAIILSVYAWLNPGLSGAWALVAVSGSMCLMFPTIYGVALHGLGEDTKFGASGLVMAIVGGAVLPPVQGHLTDLFGSPTALVVPTLCFAAVLAYAIYDLRSGRSYAQNAEEPALPA